MEVYILTGWRDDYTSRVLCVSHRMSDIDDQMDVERDIINAGVNIFARGYTVATWEDGRLIVGNTDIAP